MSGIDYLYDALENEKEFNMYSSVYTELNSDNPSITIWESKNDLNITSTMEFNMRSYYDKDAIKIFEVNDKELVKRIYNGSFKYTNSYNEIINNLIDVYNSNSLTLK